MTPDTLGIFLLEDSEMEHKKIPAGTIFNDWTVLDKPPFKKDGHWFYFCECICGNTKVIYSSYLKNNDTTKCKECYIKKMKANPPAYKDGGKYRRLRRSWTDMHSRCYNVNNTAYSRYGGRGLIVCQEWFSFKTFKKWALSHNYNDKLTIERINNNGNYEPNNCKWTTYKEQNRNKRNNVHYEAFGKSKIIADWADDDKCIVPESTLWNRLKRGNWDIKHALTFPRNPGLSYKQMMERYT